MQTLKNSFLTVKIKEQAAELSSIVATKNNAEYLWRGDAKFWGGQAPVLFPFVGRLKNDTFIANNKEYSQKQHGFFRKSNTVEILEKTDNKVTFSIKSSEEIKKVYPYDFEFRTSYELIENNIKVTHEVFNQGTEDLYFSLGEHPAFNCSLVNPDESYENCSLEFEYAETDATWNLNSDGLLNNTTTEVLNETQTLDLHKDSFSNDALIFKNLKSKKISLINKKEGKLITVSFKDFPFLGIWSKPNAPYVCLEPWLGIADNINSSQKIEEKEGIISLAPNKNFTASYSIEVHA